MKKLMIVSLSIVLLTPVFALASSILQEQGQDQPKQGDSTAQALNVPGKISQDGETFVSDADGKTWTIANPEAVKGHEGHHVLLQAKLDVDKNEVKVVAVKVLKQSDTGYNTQK